ncbi:oleosin L-like [Bidens hawaiensis]|uniref:oleosin L-like n=1 Tax=Bidens hawaiensis TaxID=980011 RepID=UPI00404B2947
MTDVYRHQEHTQMRPQDQYQHKYDHQNQYQNQNQNQFFSEARVHQFVKAATAIAAGLSLLVLAGLTFVGTVIALMVATPLMVIFSPVLVPAAITLFFIVTGFLTSGAFGIAAATVLTWMYKYASTGEQPRFRDTMDQATEKIGSIGLKAREFMDNTGTGAGTGAGGRHDYEAKTRMLV